MIRKLVLKDLTLKQVVKELKNIERYVNAKYILCVQSTNSNGSNEYSITYESDEEYIKDNIEFIEVE